MLHQPMILHPFLKTIFCIELSTSLQWIKKTSEAAMGVLSLAKAVSRFFGISLVGILKRYRALRFRKAMQILKMRLDGFVMEYNGCGCLW